MAASSSQGTSSSPFGLRIPSSPYSSTSSSSSLMTGGLNARSARLSFYGGGGYDSRSMTSSGNKGYHSRSRTPVSYPPMDERMIVGLEGDSRSADSICATIRFRPMSEFEYQRGDEISWYADGDKNVRNEFNPVTAYAFDKVFGPNATTNEVYEVAAKSVVKAAMEGINGTVFAYGVTSSGKTHTMHGDQHSPGIIPLAIKDIFSIIQDTPGREFLLRVSYLEIYNEVINDLLDPTGQNLRIREDAQGTYVEGIKEEVVLSPGHALSFIAAGEGHRHVGSNNLNLFSSRSHTIFTLMIESSARGDDYDGVTFSQLNLIDLAGSESSKTETTGLRKKEGSYINKSLLTLGTVIGKLSERKTSHVPFRDSKLTRLLQTSLSGNGHVSLICTITPASSNMEETHNTLKFASRAKRVEVYASCNKILDERSLIKKYQREISFLRAELDQLRRRISGGANHEEIMLLRQKLEEGQVKMKTRLQEEEEAKASLMNRIQTLTKLILVSSRSTLPGYTSEIPSDDDEGITISNHVELLLEQVKMLNGEIALGTSALKRLVEHSIDNPESSKPQIDNLEREMHEKRKQIGILEQQIVTCREAFVSNESLLEMQQTLKKLMAECSEKGFELEIKTADNRVLQEQLENKCSENNKLQEKVVRLEQQLATSGGDKMLEPSEGGISDECAKELRKKIQSQELENESLKLKHAHILEKNCELRVQNQTLADEALYAKELASAAALELKALAAEVTKLSLLNAKLEKELQGARELNKTNSSIRRLNDTQRSPCGFTSRMGSHFDSFGHDFEGLKFALQQKKQREITLEAALVEKENLEDEYRKKIEEAKKREASLENDLKNMWVIFAQLKKERDVLRDQQVNEMHIADNLEPKLVNDLGTPSTGDAKGLPNCTPFHDAAKEESPAVQEKVGMQEKEKQPRCTTNGDANSHVCKVCFESSTSTIFLPCRHFCLCKSCSLACSECPICRTTIADRIFAFT